jgi:hypothetical protein
MFKTNKKLKMNLFVVVLLLVHLVTTLGERVMVSVTNPHPHTFEPMGCDRKFGVTVQDIGITNHTCSQLVDTRVSALNFQYVKVDCNSDGSYQFLFSAISNCATSQYIGSGVDAETCQLIDQKYGVYIYCEVDEYNNVIE